MTGEMGALAVIDADAVVHDLMATGTNLTDDIVRSFGEHVRAPDGSVDRSALGKLVFRDTQALRTLESMVHPAVRSAIAGQIKEYADAGASGVITVEAIRLLQSPLREQSNRIWIVRCDAGLQKRRLREERGYGEAEIGSRIAASPDFEDADATIITNDGSLNELWEAVAAAWTSVRALVSATGSGSHHINR
jgi:dephospho-CoA kinase